MQLERRDAVLVLLAPALMLWLDWNGLRAWFHQDDFAWLALARSVNSPESLWRALLEPAAQGTVRIWSERLFFLVLERLSGLDHRPFHLAVLATQTANLGLLYWLTLRMSRSRMAATAAPLLWAASPALAVPLAWLSAYNQILCAFFALAAFACLLRWLDTGRRAWFAAQAALFVLGFGALEVMVVYPALATAWCWLERRRVPVPVWWLWAPSLLFAAAHMALIPKPSTGVYARHWDGSMALTYRQYWKLALAAEPSQGPPALPWLPRPAAGTAAAAAALAWVAFAARRGLVLPVFGLLWFTAALAPVLPLRDHVSDYYLTLPAVGVAWVFASGLAEACRRAKPLCAGAAAVTVLLAIQTGTAHRASADWRYGRGREARYLYHALERAAELHRERLLVVSGIDSELFWGAFFDARLLFRQRICLDPREAGQIDVPAGFNSIAPAVCQPAEIGAAARRRMLTAYRWEPRERRLRAWTRLYFHRLPRAWLELPPSDLALASADDERWLLHGWHQPEAGGRWMGREAEALLAAPAGAGRRLRVAGLRPANLLERPIELRVLVEEREIGRVRVERARPSFDVLLPLPEQRGEGGVRVRLSVDRTDRAPGDVRELGLFLTRLAVQ